MVVIRAVISLPEFHKRCRSGGVYQFQSQLHWSVAWTPEEIFAWLEKNLQGNWDLYWDDGLMWLMFTHSPDAVMFALRWPNTSQ